MADAMSNKLRKIKFQVKVLTMEKKLNYNSK